MVSGAPQTGVPRPHAARRLELDFGAAATLALTATDIERLEIRWRMRADALRKSAAIPVDGPGLRALAEAELAEAKDLDATADLLLGLQGCWEHHGGDILVRDGYKRMSRAYDKSKTYTLAVEVKIEAEPTEAAA